MITKSRAKGINQGILKVQNTHVENIKIKDKFPKCSIWQPQVFMA